MAVVCKFYAARVATIEGHGPYDQTYCEATLRPVVNGSAENKAFYAWTPGGEATIRGTRALVEPLKGPGEFYMRLAREAETAREAGMLRFRVASIGNRSDAQRKLFDITLHGQDDAAGSVITLSTINEAAARAFLGFEPVCVWFEPATGPVTSA